MVHSHFNGIFPPDAIVGVNEIMANPTVRSPLCQPSIISILLNNQLHDPVSMNKRSGNAG